MAHDVFISYAHKDKPTADAACATLESRGIRCWIAPRDVLPGEEYASALVGAIHASRLLVLVFSSGANQSPQVLREVERAVSKGLPILPLRIEDVAPSAAMEYYISSRHWLDALTTPLEQHLVQLAETVKLLLSRTAAIPAAAVPVQAVKPVPPPAVETLEAPVAPIPTSTPPPPRVPPATTDPNRDLRRRIAFAGVVIVAVVGSLRGWEHATAQMFGWSNAQGQVLALLRLLVLALSLAAGGLMLRRSQPRKLATVAGLLYGGALLLTGLGAPALGASFPFLLASSCLAAAGTGLGFIVAITTSLKWFPDRPGMIAGITTAAFAIGGIGIRTILSVFGLRLLFIAGILSLIAVTLAARMLRNPPPDYAPAGWIPSPPRQRLRAIAPRRLREALASWQWYALWAILFLNTAAGVIAVLTVPAGHFPPGALGPALAALSVAGSLVWAWISDRLGGRLVFLLILAAQALLLLAVPVSYQTAELLTLVAIFCNGGGFGTMPALAADYFGSEDVGAVYGLLLSAWCLALQVAPLLIFYGPSGPHFLVPAGMLLCAAVIAFRLRPPNAASIGGGSEGVKT